MKIKIEEKTETKLVCDRVTNYNNNRCLNCGSKVGHKCEILKK
jgi:hypothetical protein